MKTRIMFTLLLALVAFTGVCGLCMLAYATDGFDRTEATLSAARERRLIRESLTRGYENVSRRWDEFQRAYAAGSLKGKVPAGQFIAVGKLVAEAGEDVRPALATEDRLKMRDVDEKLREADRLFLKYGY